MTTNSDASQAVELPTNEEIELFAAKLVREQDLPWLGFRQDSGGRYTIPVVSQSAGELVRAAIAQDRATRAQAEPEGWRAALQFYADRSHFLVADSEAWDTVSGEPANLWCDEEGTATVEDGTVAARALSGKPLRFEDEDAARAQGAGEAVDGWPKEWLRDGWNGCMLSAIAALQFLANNVRPSGGSSNFNSEHLFQIASELAITREKLLTAPTIPQAAEVPGFVLVPREPTPAMMRVGLSSMWPRAAYQNVAVENVWIRMCRVGADPSTEEMTLKAIAAAPTPTASAAKAEGEARKLAFRGLLGVIGTAQAQAARIIAKDGDADDLRQDRCDLPLTLATIQRAVESLSATQPPSEADRTREGGDDRPVWFGVQDEVTLTRAVHVMNDVLGDIEGWEDKALAEAVRDAKVDLMAMIECIRMNADDSYVPGSKLIDGEAFGTTTSEGAKRSFSYKPQPDHED